MDGCGLHGGVVDGSRVDRSIVNKGNNNRDGVERAVFNLTMMDDGRLVTIDDDARIAVGVRSGPSTIENGHFDFEV